MLVKGKVERLLKIEMASDMDEILKEEIKEYKEILMCLSLRVFLYSLISSLRILFMSEAISIHRSLSTLHLTSTNILLTVFLLIKIAKYVSNCQT